MEKINFKSPEHKKFYEAMLAETKKQDRYHRAFFYVTGLSDITRTNIKRLFDFKNDCVNLESLREGWQTSGSMQISILAFHLWNGEIREGKEELLLPDSLFRSNDMEYFFEGIRLRYPEYVRHVSVEQYMDRFER